MSDSLPTGDGNAAQTRLIAEQVARAVVVEVNAERGPPRRELAEIPPTLKWAGAIAAVLMTVGVGGMASWLVTSVSEMQVTLARMDERMASQNNSQDGRYTDLTRRVDTLEGYHHNGRDEK